MERDKLTEEIAKGKAAYFRAADAALEKIQLQHGKGPEGLLNFLNRKKDGAQKPAQQTSPVKPQKKFLN